jgi:hypothetical protein
VNGLLVNFRLFVIFQQNNFLTNRNSADILLNLNYRANSIKQIIEKAIIRKFSRPQKKSQQFSRSVFLRDIKDSKATDANEAIEVETEEYPSTFYLYHLPMVPVTALIYHAMLYTRRVT